jgi:hypothetical protein
MQEARSAEVRWFPPFYEVFCPFSYRTCLKQERENIYPFFLKELLHLDRTLLSLAGSVIYGPGFPFLHSSLNYEDIDNWIRWEPLVKPVTWRGRYRRT